MMAKVQACTDEKINVCLAKSCSEFMACINSLGQGGGGGGEQQKGSQQGSNSAIEAKFKSCIPQQGGGGQSSGSGSQPSSGNYGPPPGSYTGPSSGGGDQSQIPQGYSSWTDFCKANPGDSRCTSYKPQIPQQYPLLLRYQPFAAILNFLLGH